MGEDNTENDDITAPWFSVGRGLKIGGEYTILKYT